MSKIHIFKFKLPDNDKSVDEAIDTINDFLRMYGFDYDSNKKCYATKEPSQKEKNRNAAISVSSSLLSALSGGSMMYVVSTQQLGFEYEINGSELTIKPFIINNQLKSKESVFANRYYYGYLKNYLFRSLQNKNITYKRKSTEKIKDGSGFKLAKFIFLYMAILLIICIVIFVILLR